MRNRAVNINSVLRDENVRFRNADVTWFACSAYVWGSGSELRRASQAALSLRSILHHHFTREWHSIAIWSSDLIRSDLIWWADVRIPSDSIRMLQVGRPAFSLRFLETVSVRFARAHSARLILIVITSGRSPLPSVRVEWSVMWCTRSCRCSTFIIDCSSWVRFLVQSLTPNAPGLSVLWLGLISSLLFSSHSSTLSVTCLLCFLLSAPHYSAVRYILNESTLISRVESTVLYVHVMLSLQLHQRLHQ